MRNIVSSMTLKATTKKLTFQFQCYMKLKIYMTLCMALLVGCLYQGCGNDATKALFNFGFCFTVTIAFMYNPLMPVLLQCKCPEFHFLPSFPSPIPYLIEFVQFPVRLLFCGGSISTDGSNWHRITGRCYSVDFPSRSDCALCI